MLSHEESFASSACKLECVKDLPPVHEFVGPVKIVLMDMPKGIYTQKACISAFVALAHMLMAVTTMVVLMYTVAFKTPLMMNLHILLCTIGYQLFIPSAILMINSLHGPSSSLKQEDRQLQHLILQVFGVACATAGSVLVMLSEGSFKSKLTPHALIGLVAGALSGVAALTGPAIYFLGEYCKFGKKTHALFGVPGFFASSISFMVAIITSKTFKAWVAFEPDLTYILVVFCVIYSVIIITTPIMRFFGKAP